MSIIHSSDLPPLQHLMLYDLVKSAETRNSVKLSGLLQMLSSGVLIIAVPTSLVRGVFDALHAPGICLPSSIDGGAVRAGIIVMTPEEVTSVGGPAKITERGKPYSYNLGQLVEVPAKNWPGVSTCWHLEIKSQELEQLRRSYGLPSKLAPNTEFSIVVACRKTGVLTANSKSKTSTQPAVNKLPDWTKPN